MYRGVKVKFQVTSLFDHFDTVATAITRERGVLAGFLRALYLEHDLVDQSYVVQHKDMEQALVASADRARQVANQALTDQ